MAYEFACDNVVPGCEGKVTGETKDEVLVAAATHAANAHGMDELPDEVVEQVQAAIVEVD